MTALPPDIDIDNNNHVDRTDEDDVVIDDSRGHSIGRETGRPSVDVVVAGSNSAEQRGRRQSTVDTTPRPRSRAGSLSKRSASRSQQKNTVDCIVDVHEEDNNNHNNHNGFNNNSFTNSYGDEEEDFLYGQELDTDAILMVPVSPGGDFFRPNTSARRIAWWSPFVTLDRNLLKESLPSLVLAMVGLISAGALLDTVQHWHVFNNVSELIMLVPVLLNLKGNLEMNLAARLSTAANLGHFRASSDKTKSILSGYIFLLLLQSTIIACVASASSIVLGIVVHGRSNPLNETLLMLTAGIGTGVTSSLFMGAAMCWLIVTCDKIGWNPDNIATPMAASLGDLVTLSIMSGWTVFFNWCQWTTITVIVLIIFLILTPWYVHKVRSNDHVADKIFDGWFPLIAAMSAGVVLEEFIRKYTALAVLAPVMNGLAGNLGAINTSRYATSLHADRPETSLKTPVTLFWINVPIQIIFLSIVAITHMSHINWTVKFVGSYMTVSNILVMVLLYVSNWLTTFNWKRGYDPHTNVIPYVASLGDVLGTSLLVCAMAAVGQT